jgi:hypothetical protein
MIVTKTAIVVGAICLTLVFAIVLLGTANKVHAHCDTMNGPIIPEAKAALEKGDVTPILKWVKKDKEAEIRLAFAKAVAVRVKGSDERELADQYFLETLVRLHRAGEGAPYTGLKDQPVEPIVAMADKALADDSADEMIKRISGHMAKAIREKYNKALEAKRNKDKSVEAGREFVEAYVIYMHYIEGIHTAVMSAGSHHGEVTEGGIHQEEQIEHKH